MKEWTEQQDRRKYPEAYVEAKQMRVHCSNLKCANFEGGFCILDEEEALMCSTRKVKQVEMHSTRL